MTSRERFLSTILFGEPDRIPLDPGRGRRSTLAAWHAQGLPAEASDPAEYAYRLAGGTLPWPKAGEGFDLNSRMMPEFEERVLSRGERTQIVQDWKGNVCEISNEYGTEHLRYAIDFVTRRWVRCPVESRADWKDMKRRYDADEPLRLPADAAALGARLERRDWPVAWNFSGPFWQLREWMGFEGFCTALYDDPALVREMIATWEGFVSRLLERALAHVVPDEVHISEDMAYKSFSMISPAMTREFLMPTWRRWGEIVRGAGVPVYAIDSDGFVGELIPLWIESGLNCCDPVEVAAGNDIAAFRKAFGRRMAFRGGVDKRAMAKGGRAIEAEMARIEPVIRDGGFIPSCDHGVPSDVSWPDFVHYTGLIAKATGWL